MGPNVLFVSGAQNGCDWYRIRQPAYKIIEKNALNCGISCEMTEDELQLSLNASDLIVTQHFSEKFLDFLEKEKRPDQKVVFDYDDNIFNVSPYNPSYRFHGTREVNVTMADGKEMNLWKQGVNGFDLSRNQGKIGVFQEVLERADLVTTPSLNLANVWKENGAKRVKVIKNFIDPKLWAPLSIQRDEYIRIGYQGGWSHYEDWMEISEALAEVMQKYPNVLLIVMGQHYPGAVKGIPEDRVIVEPWISIDAYPWKFKTLRIDIGLAPLAKNEFSVCKSEIKWEEYSALGIATVASNTPPYSVAIDDEKTGLLAKTKEDWVKALSALIENEKLRKDIAGAARETVLKRYDVNERVWDHINAYKSLFKQEILVAKGGVI